MAKRLLVLIAVVLLTCTARASASVEEPNLVAFVGQKISVNESKEMCCNDCICMDAVFKAKYRVLQLVYGQYSEREIEFDVFDHFGVPAFSRFENVLLFVSRRADGRFYHQKYLYYDVYQTINGAWVGCGSPYRYGTELRSSGAVRVQPLQLKEPVWFSLKGLSSAEIKKRYPKDDFRHSEGRAYCSRGTPVEGLFQVVRDGVLKARKVF